MFKFFAEEYVNIFTFLNLFNYITFRTGAAILTSLFFSLIFGEIIIKYLSSFQPIGQPIRIDGPTNHIIEKAGTPTMGGILILSSISVSILLWSDLKNHFIWICFITCVIFGAIGFVDDYFKIKSKNSNGISATKRILLQIFFSLIIIYLIQYFLPKSIAYTVHFPFFKRLIIDFGIFYFA